MSAAVELLSKSQLFSQLAPQHRDQIAPHFTRHEWAAGADIVKQGDPGDALYVVESGMVGVFVKDPRLGIVQLVTQLESPEAFGEMALVTQERRTATCTAMTPVIALRLTREVFLAIAQQVPAVALSVARTLADRLKAMTSEHEIPWVNLAGKQLDPKLWAMIPDALARQSRVVPLEMSGRTMTIGMVDPTDVTAADALGRALPGMRLKIVAVNAEAWQRFVDQGTGGGVAKRTGAQTLTLAGQQRVALQFLGEEEDRTSRVSITNLTGPQVVGIVDEILGTGLAVGASDIHIEPDRRGVLVRYRIDGALQNRKDLLPLDVHRPLVSRLKILAKLDIAEQRKPQDGRISLRAGQKLIDLRLSTMPAKLGEKIVMRILDAESGITDLKALFVVDKVRQVFSQMVFRPHGLVMITGPTGSGKTTTLYSALAARRKPELNVVTVEDPIEYHLDGVTQVEVKPEQGVTFEAVLRALLRQDPNVIMVGELRDHSTARMAVEASMTGHLVMTSVHTNGALDAVLRLADLGVERYAIANGLIGVLHQRLVRRICSGCAKPFDYPPPIVEQFYKVGAFLPNEKPMLQRGEGCAACNGTGFKGRIGLYELLVITDAVRDAIASGAGMPELKAVSAGAMIELARYAGMVAGAGLTAPGEVLHMLQRVGG